MKAGAKKSTAERIGKILYGHAVLQKDISYQKTLVSEDVQEFGKMEGRCCQAGRE